jgi:hypothetical protein
MRGAEVGIETRSLVNDHAPILATASIGVNGVAHKADRVVTMTAMRGNFLRRLGCRDPLAGIAAAGCRRAQILSK